jgi:hypothetical protein
MPRGIGSPAALRMARTRIMAKSGIGPRAFSCGREAIESVDGGGVGRCECVQLELWDDEGSWCEIVDEVLESHGTETV